MLSGPAPSGTGVVKLEMVSSHHPDSGSQKSVAIDIVQNDSERGDMVLSPFSPTRK